MKTMQLQGWRAVTILVTAVALAMAFLAASGDRAQAAGPTNAVTNGIVYTGAGSFTQPASGVPVYSFIWPDATYLANMADGASVPVYWLPLVTTDANGQFFVPLANDTSIPAMYKEDDGTMNVESDIYVGNGKSEIDVGNSVVFDSTTGGWDDAETGVGISTTNEYFLNPTSGMVQDGAYTSDESADAGAQSDSVPVQTNVAQTPGNCEYRLIAGSEMFDRPEHFLNVNSRTFAPGTVSESKGAKTTMGVGITVDGVIKDMVPASAKISLSGSSSASVGASQSGIVDQAVYNQVNTRDFAQYCGPPRMPPSGWTKTGKIVRRPVQVAAFLDHSFEHGITHTFYGITCQGAAVGFAFNTGNAHSGTISGGLDIGPVSVSAQMGWNSNSNLKLGKFTKAGHVCGDVKAGVNFSHHVDSEG